MAHSAGYLVMLHRLYADGHRDFVNSVEFPKLTSAKRTAATWSRGEGMRATVYDLQNHGQALYQYHKGHQVARASNPLSLSLPRNKWVNAKVQVTSSGKVLAKVDENVLSRIGKLFNRRRNPYPRLPSEIDSTSIDRKVKAAASRQLGKRGFRTFFEHGHWWVEHPRSGAQWSVYDTPDGFGFEQITRGDED